MATVWGWCYISNVDEELFKGFTVCRVMMIVAQEQAEEVQKREARRLEARKQQAQAALEHSKLRQLRGHRLSGLKVSTAPSSEMAKGLIESPEWTSDEHHRCHPR